jgi:hypothetical protein
LKERTIAVPQPNLDLLGGGAPANSEAPSKTTKQQNENVEKDLEPGRPLPPPQRGTEAARFGDVD